MADHKNDEPISCDANDISPDSQLANETRDQAIVECIPAAPRKRLGRIVSLVWALFTDSANPQNEKSAVCRHCKQNVLHYKSLKLLKSTC
ncbi:MAG: hypothetical protein RL536_435 [Candidatus Parcubacteria bacterium]